MSQLDLLGVAWSCERRGTGPFHCPRCRTEQQSVHADLQRRLTVLGRPVVRLGPAKAYRVCDRCGHAFATGAEERSASGDLLLAEDELGLLGILAAVVFSDSAVRSAEKEVVAAVIRHYAPGIADLEVDDLLRRARHRWGDPVDRLERLPGLVDERIRRRIVEAAYHVCAADGELHPQEARLLDRIGTTLELAPRTVRQAIMAARHHPIVSESE